MFLVRFLFLLLVSFPVCSQPSCVQFARTVEGIDTLQPSERARLEKELMTKDRRDERVWTTLRAINFIKAGGTPGDAWKQCPVI